MIKLTVGALIVLLDPSDITHISGNQTVNETEEVTLNCSAKGLPTPSTNWTRVSDNSPVSFPLTITGKQDEGGYRCTADNGIGDPESQVVYIIVESKLKLYAAHVHVYHGFIIPYGLISKCYPPDKSLSSR